MSLSLRHRLPPPTALLGLGIVALYGFVAVFASLLAPYAENAVVGYEYEPWGGAFLLGTDALGRDMASRLIFGTRNTVGLAFVTTVLAFLAGTGAGLGAALAGGWFDQLLSRLVDVLMALPPLIFKLLLLTIFGTSVINMVLIIALIDATRVFRVARAVGAGIVVQDYIEAARLRGEGAWWLLVHEILPNAVPPLAAEFGLRFCSVFLAISTLSFLGLGLQPPTADWGSMVRENASLISFGDITPVLPALAIAVLTIAVNFIADWLLHMASGLKD